MKRLAFILFFAAIFSTLGENAELVPDSGIPIPKVEFDAKGDLTSSTYVWYVFKDGKYSEAPAM